MISIIQTYIAPYLQVLFPGENNGFCFDFPLFNVNLVATQDDWYLGVADPYQITVPVWYILVCDARCDIKHQDGTLT